MHFLAILAMRFNVPVYFDIRATEASALFAILLAGLALLIKHFGVRTQRKAIVSGAIFGMGIVAMHYVDSRRLRGVCRCIPPLALGWQGVLAIVMGIAAITIAYGARTEHVSGDTGVWRGGDGGAFYRDLADDG